MILCIGTTPAAQRVMIFKNFALDTVNRAATTLDGAAGKSVNVAKVLKAVGERPLATGFLGGDRGEELRRLLASKGIEMDFITVSAPTRQCITVIDESARTITELVEESRPVPDIEYERLTGTIRRRIAGSRAVVMSGTLTPAGPLDFYQRCTTWAHEAGALTVIDAQGLPLTKALEVKPGLVKPNRQELAATVGHEFKTESEIIAAMCVLHERGAERVVVTAGKDPTLAFDGLTIWRIRPPLISAVNPIGSGDAFTAGLVWRLLRGEDLGEACRWAAAAGAANALTLMAGELDPKDVARLASEVTIEPL
jgi:tagatose 6-phosphate kinase